MKTIEERAKEFAQNFEIIPNGMDCEDCDTCTKCKTYRRYVDIATEQKAIDDAKWLKIKSAWEKEAQINHDDVANRKQGYHDAIEEAYKWIKANTEGGVHPQNAYGFAHRFLKEMEK